MRATSKAAMLAFFPELVPSARFTVGFQVQVNHYPFKKLLPNPKPFGVEWYGWHFEPYMTASMGDKFKASWSMVVNKFNCSQRR